MHCTKASLKEIYKWIKRIDLLRPVRICIWICLEHCSLRTMPLYPVSSLARACDHYSPNTEEWILIQNEYLSFCASPSRKPFNAVGIFKDRPNGYVVKRVSDWAAILVLMWQLKIGRPLYLKRHCTTCYHSSTLLFASSHSSRSPEWKNGAPLWHCQGSAC